MDDGLVLFIMAADRKLRFEVGYGLEPTVPDAIASRVINDVIVPRIQSGDRDGAVIAGMDAVMSVIGGGGLPASARDGQRRGRQSRPLSLGQMILFGIIGLVVLFIFVTNPSLAMYLLFSILSGGRGGGDGGGGGGSFGGGGGRSGGGGASGSW
jgi:uncharacterized protein